MALKNLKKLVLKKKEKKKKKKEKKEKKKEKEKKKRKNGTMNSVKLLHIKCCFFSNFSIVRWHWKIKKIPPPKKKLKWRPWSHWEHSTFLHKTSSWFSKFIIYGSPDKTQIAIPGAPLPNYIWFDILLQNCSWPSAILFSDFSFSEIIQIYEVSQFEFLFQLLEITFENIFLLLEWFQFGIRCHSIWLHLQRRQFSNVKF